VSLEAFLFGQEDGKNKGCGEDQLQYEV